MSHQPHDHVHRLIRSMSPAEKRYFKLYTGRHIVSGQSHYRDLFDAIARMDEYDEREIHVRFAGEAFLRRFTVIKHRLYDTILASLEAFHADSSVDARLQRQLHQVEILYQRGLYPDAERLLRGVRALARQHGRTNVGIQAAEWERRLMERTNYEQVRETDLEELTCDIDRLREEHQQIERLWQLKSRSFMLLYRHGKARNERMPDKLRKLLDDPLLGSEQVLLTPKARYLFHHIHSAAAYALNDRERCEQHLSANAALLAGEPDHFQDEPNLLMGILSNLSHVRMRMGRYAEAAEGLKRFKMIPATLPTAPSRDLEMKVFAMGTSLELALRCRLGDFTKAAERGTYVEEGFRRYADSLSVIRRAGLSFQLAWANFGCARYDAAARWLRSLLNEKGIEAHEEVHAMARLLELLILVETGKSDLLRYAVRNADRFLKNHHRYHRFEEAILRYVKARAQTSSTTRETTAHKEFVAALSELDKDPLNGAAFDHFDPLCYALSRAHGKSMEEVARERSSEDRGTANGGLGPKRRAA